ncbi:uncharacterized protein LOC124258720 [Haliotis rubra]|uniref:uncharacterized protein LOC124258720 n=1 Tax=Haliotis rubra TaxID=36100 RepID=UPI001EE54E0C|nr:uncharacterized protein LOC124258720 [Haliotis rubra]
MVIVHHPVKVVVLNRAKTCFTTVNGIKRPLPYEGLTRPCCMETSFNGNTTARRFSCEDDGGCCGDYGSQSCCNVPNSSLAVGLGVGLTILVLVLLGIIAIAIYCKLNISYHKKGQEIYCASCCKCEVRDATQPVRVPRSISAMLSDEESTFNTEVYEPRHQPYPDPDVFRTPVTFQCQTSPDIDGDSPPSYTEVVSSPKVFVTTLNFR